MAGTHEEGSEQLQDVLNRLERMEGRLQELSEQVASLHKPSVAAPLPPAPPPPPPHPAVPQPPPHPQPPAQAEPRPFAAASQAPAPHPPAPVPPPAPRPALAEGWETEIALKWMGRIGIAALFFGIAFFLQYAFRNHWIGPEGQVLGGLAAGLLLVVWGGLNQREDRRALSEALLGGGLAILYLSVYAAYALYPTPLLAHLEAFGAMALVTLFGAFLALRKESQATALLATLGGFLTPIILRGTGSGPDDYTTLLQLFSYVIILNLGLLGLSLFREWRSLQILCFAGTWLIVWGWVDGLSSHVLNVSTWSVTLALYAIYLAVPVVRNLWQRRETKETDIFLILANPSCFFPTAVVLLGEYREWLGLYALVMAALYVALARLAYLRNVSDRLLWLTWLGLGVSFMVAAVPLQFEGHWIMIGWGLEAALLVWVGQRVGSMTLRGLGLAMQVVVFGWLLLLYQLEEKLAGPAALAFLNPLFLSFLGGALTITAALLIYLYARPKAQEARQAVAALGFGLGFLVLWGVTEEMMRLDLASRFIMLWWAAVGVTLVYLGARGLGKAVTVLGMLLQGIVAAWMLGLYAGHGSGVFVPVANSYFLCFVLGAMSLGGTLALLLYDDDLRKQFATLVPAYVVALAFLSVWGLSAETIKSLDLLPSTPAFPAWGGVKSFALSIVWCLCAGGMIGLGMARRYPLLRQIGVVVFGIAILKVFIVDSSDLDTIWRVLSFVCLGAILIAVSYLYHLYRERVQEFMAGGGAARPEDDPGETEE